MSQIRVNIDGREIKTHSGHTILEVAKENGIEIPTLCHNEKIKNYGSCGICVVEVEGNPRLIRSCSTEIFDGMIVKTATERIIESRKTTLELLLTDHTGDCKAPCTLGCPSNVDVQGYVGLAANEQYEEALKLIKKDLPFPASIGRVCPHPCQTACRRQLIDDSISIAWVKSFIADIDLAKDEPYMPEMKGMNGKKIAVVGGGPSGMTAAYYLRKEGYDVTVYEAMQEFGGMLKYGIPLYRLPKEVLLSEVEQIRKMGVKLIPNIRIGRDITLAHLREEHDAVYVSIGAWKSASLNCQGQDLKGVYGGIDFLTKFAVNEPIKVGERIAVIGGGNTAMDACRTAMRLGAKEVYAIYRRTKEDMPAVDVEIKEAEEEGITFKFLRNPVEIIGDNDGEVKKIRLEKMAVVATDASGRRKVANSGEEDEIIEVDSVIVSIGQKLEGSGFEDLTFTERGNIWADERTYQTNLEGVFAGGDATNNGADIAIAAIADAKNAAKVMHSYLEGSIEPIVKPYYVKRENLTRESFPLISEQKMAHMGHEKPEDRKHNFEEVVYGYTTDEASEEANRCLECGCHDSFECDLLTHSNSYDVQPERIGGEKHVRENNDNHLYIQRDPDKCILCGMCVRICDEVMDNTALGLVNRGFDTIVKPAMEMPLQETDCISCGQCISICPTGALMEKTPIAKPVPVNANVTSTVCANCSVGCNVNIESAGNLLLRALPVDESINSDGLLCVKGKFGFAAHQNGERITKPMIKKNGVFEEVSFKEAILYTARKAQSIHLKFNADAVGLSISDRYTNEEIFMAKSFAEQTLATKNIFTFGGLESGLKEVFGYDASTNTTAELVNTDLVMLVGSNIVEDHTIAGIKIRKAVQNGGTLININNEVSKADEWALINHKADNSVEILREILKAIIEEGAAPKNVDGFDELVASLADVKVSEMALDIAKRYFYSKKAMIVFDQSRVTTAAEVLIAQIATVSGHIGKPRDGVIQFKPNCNSQGLVDLGIDTNVEKYATAIKNKEIKGLLVFGEDIDTSLVEGLEFLMVQETHMTEVAKLADVILPASVYSETEGTMTTSDRKIQKINRVGRDHVEKLNIEMIMDLMNVFGTNCYYKNSAEILKELSKSVKEYSGIANVTEEDVYWPIAFNRVLYTIEFATKSGRANLNVTSATTKMFRDFVNTNHITKNFISKVF